MSNLVSFIFLIFGCKTNYFFNCLGKSLYGMGPFFKGGIILTYFLSKEEKGAVYLVTQKTKGKFSDEGGFGKKT